MTSLNLTSSEIKSYNNDIENGKALFRKPLQGFQESFAKEMGNYRRYVRGEFYKDKDKIGYDKVVPVNEFWAILKTMAPNLYFRRPEINLTPHEKAFEVEVFDPYTNQMKVETKDGKLTAKTAADVLNYYGGEQQLNDEYVVKSIIEDALVCGIGVHDQAWLAEPEINMQPDWKKVEQGKMTPAMKRLIMQKAQRGELVDGEQYDPANLKYDNLISRRISPFNLLVDPECTDKFLKTARYMGYVWNLPTKYVNKLFGVKLQGTDTALFADSENMDRSDELANFNLRRNEVVQLFDIENQRIIYKTKELEQPLLVTGWDIGLQEFPATLLVFNEDNDRFIPIPDFRQVKHQVFEKMRLRSKMAELLSRMRKTFLADDRIQKQLDAILNGEEGGVAPVKRNAGEDLRGFLMEVADFTISESMIAYGKIIDADIERQSALPDYQRQLAENIKRTATEMVEVSGNMNLRIEERQTTVKNFIIRLNSKRLKLLQENATSVQTLPLAKENFPEWSAEDIQGQFHFDMDVGSMLRKNKAVLRKQSREDYDAFKQDSWFKQRWVRENVLRARDINPDEALVDELPPEPPKDKPKLSISMKLEPADLENPNIVQLLQQANVELRPVQDVVGKTPEEQQIERLEEMGAQVSVNKHLSQEQPKDENTMERDIIVEAERV